MLVDTQVNASGKYYSVDRRGVYFEGRALTLAPNETAANDVESHVHQRYPQGFSRHGIQYFRDAWIPGTFEDWRGGMIEQLLEATRLAHYPDRPGRFQSVFATDSLDWAKNFRETHGRPEHGVYEIQPQNKVHRGDMGLLAVGNTFATTDHKMHLYWQGKTLELAGYSPFWEYVIELPALVAGRVA